MQQALLWPSMVVEWCLWGIVILLGGGECGGFNGFGCRRSGLRLTLCIRIIEIVLKSIQSPQ